MDKDAMVTITKTEYDRLVKAEAVLNALLALGVDNWEGYAEAVRDVNGAEL